MILLTNYKGIERKTYRYVKLGCLIIKSASLAKPGAEPFHLFRRPPSIANLPCNRFGVDDTHYLVPTRSTLERTSVRLLFVN